MRSTFAIAALAAGALAVPFNKREIVTDVEVVLHTEIVTVYATAGDAAAPTAAANKHYGHGGNTWGNAPAPAPATTVIEAPAPAPTTAAAPTTTSIEAPVWTAPATTEVYVAPTTTESPVWVAPTTTEAPVWVAPTTTSSEEAQAWTAPAVTEAAAPAPTQESVQAPAPAPAPASSGDAPTDYAGLVVFTHNQHRQNHSSPALAWDADLAASAMEVAKSCNYAHNVDVNGGGYGQNIAAGVKAENIATVITDMFYNGEVGYFAKQYGKPNPNMADFEKWGHFSQIVWAATTTVGCATYDCSGQGLSNTGGGVAPYFTVCNYKNPGNYAGKYADNIKAPADPLRTIVGTAFKALTGY